MATVPTPLVDEADKYTLPPFLRRVRIRGYKSIGFCDVQLHPLTILVGRNAAGKSNFLDALAFLRDTMQFGVAEAVKRRGGWPSVACRTSILPTTVEIEIDAGFDCGGPQQPIQANGGGKTTPANGEPIPSLEGHRFSARYRVVVAGGDQGPPIVQKEVLDLTDETAHQKGGFDLQRHPPYANVLNWKGDSASATAFREAFKVLLPQRADVCLLSMIGFQPFLELSEGLRLMGFYNFNPDEIRCYQRPNPGWLLEKNGSNLASVIEGLDEIDPESAQRVRDYLKIIAEEVGNFEVIRYGDLETVRFRLRDDSDKVAFEFDAASMSDGTLRAWPR